MYVIDVVDVVEGIREEEGAARHNSIGREESQEIGVLVDVVSCMYLYCV